MSFFLKFFILAVFLNALTWIVLIPLWQYPDEQAHFAQIQGIAESGQIPTTGSDTSYEVVLSEKILGTERNGFGNNKYTYHPEYNIQYSDSLIGLFEEKITNLPKSARTTLVKDEATHNPPLYYFLGSLFYKVFYNFDLFARVYAVRLMSSLIFLGTIFVTFRIGKLIFGNSKILPLALASLVAFKPMLVFASTGILSDTLTNFLFSLVLFFSLKIIKGGFKFSHLAILSFTVVFGVLTRQQFLITIPIIFMAVIYQIAKNPKYAKYFILFVFFFLIFIYLANTVLISNPIFTNFRVPEIFDSGFLKFAFEKSPISNFPAFFIWTIKHTVAEVWPWYWGVYRWLSLTLPPPYYQIINRLIIVAILGLSIKLFLTFKKREFNKNFVYIIFLILASTIYFVVLTIWDYIFYLEHGFSFGIQGRYFFPLALAHVAIILIGLLNVFETISRKYLKWAIFTIIVLMILFNDLSLFFISGSYYSTSSLNSFIVQASQYKPSMIKGDTILIVLVMSLSMQLAFLLKLAQHILKNR